MPISSKLTLKKSAQCIILLFLLFSQIKMGGGVDSKLGVVNTLSKLRLSRTLDIKITLYSSEIFCLGTPNINTFRIGELNLSVNYLYLVTFLRKLFDQTSLKSNIITTLF